jgi:hypothetical protein
MQRTWDSYQGYELGEKVALQQISECTVKARRLFEESYVGVESRVSDLCDSESEFLSFLLAVYLQI